jgi:hypothetical protein
MYLFILKLTLYIINTVTFISLKKSITICFKIIKVIIENMWNSS